MTWGIIIVLVIIFALVVSYFNPETRQSNAKLQHLLEERPKRSHEDYRAVFFTQSDVTLEIIEVIRDIFDDQFGLDLRGLESDDDLSAEYSVIWDMDSMADVEIVVALEKTFGIEIANGEAAELRSLRMIAELVAAKINHN